MLAVHLEECRMLYNHFVEDRIRLSWRGGVMSIDKVEDEFAFLGLMSYLVDQVALMNVAAALRCGRKWRFIVNYAANGLADLETMNRKATYEQVLFAKPWNLPNVGGM